MRKKWGRVWAETPARQRGSAPAAWGFAATLALAAAGLLTPSAARAQPEAATNPVPTAVPATAPAPEAANGARDAASHQVRVSVGGSTVVRPPWPAKRVAVADPKIADIQVLSPGQVLVNGKGVGATDLFIWNEREEVWEGRVEVGIDQSAVKAELTRLFPNSNLELRQTRDLIVISGTLARAEQAESLHRFLATTGVKYLDMTTVAGVQQVQIKVLIAEANRQAVRALGINAFVAGSSFFGGSTIGSDQGGPLNPINIAPAGPVGKTVFSTSSAVSSAVTLFGGVPSADLQFFIQAMNENQYLRVLAEPSLVALSGQEASFLAGGEYPIPVVQGAGTSTNSSSITIEYKEFGVRLRFKPTVLGDGTIRLHVAPEVSQLSYGPGSIQLQGFSIPSLITRRAETTLELGSGQTFGMAGLINQTVDARSSKVPGLGEVPVLGALFRSVRYQRGDTEMVVLVTASLAEPINTATTPMVPGEFHTHPNDWELYALGEIEGRIPPKVSAVDAQWLRDTGLHRLRGPGAWATFESPPMASSAPMRNGQPAPGAAVQAAPANPSPPPSVPTTNP